MPPKLHYEASPNTLEPETNYQHTRQPSNISEMSVGEILEKYSDESQLLNHILFAKAQEDRRIAAEEWRQAEEVRLQSKYIEFELNQRQDGKDIPNSSKSSCCNQTIDSFFSGNHDDNVNTPSLFDTSFLDQHNHFSDHSSSLQAGTSPMPMITSEFHYALQQQQQHRHQHQEDVSIASTSPSIDLLSPSMFDVNSHDNSNTVVSSSPTEMDLPLFPSTLPSPPVVPSSAPTTYNGKPNSEKTAPTPTSKASTKKSGIHRTLSYECVLNLGTLNMNNIKNKRNNSASPPSTQPLDHDKVMEALRAKLRKSNSPYQNSRPKPSPEPVPPPNMYPTTGILLLNLKSRRRKSSVTKRGNNSSSSSSNSKS